MLRFPRHRPTLAEKLETCGSVEKLNGMLAQLGAGGQELTDEERQAAARRRAAINKARL